jgi:hypothetical protein
VDEVIERIDRIEHKLDLMLQMLAMEIEDEQAEQSFDLNGQANGGARDESQPL